MVLMFVVKGSHMVLMFVVKGSHMVLMFVVKGSHMRLVFIVKESHMMLVFIVKGRHVSLVSILYHCKTKASSTKCVNLRFTLFPYSTPHISVRLSTIVLRPQMEARDD